jgi:uncharacterized membrane protein
MEPAMMMGMFAILFVGTHIGLATGRIRASLVARLGERGFAAMFSAIASFTFAAMIVYYATHRFAGAPGLALGAIPEVRWILIAAVVVGIMLMSAGSVTYAGSPYDVVTHKVRPPYGIERVTRHPFFSGVTLLGFAHALLATRLIGTVTFSALALLAAAGSSHQDHKLLTRSGERYARYLAQTSALPFAAIIRGTQKMAWRELPLAALTVGLFLSFALRLVHDRIFDHSGLFVIAAVVGGAGAFTLHSWYQARRPTATQSPLAETYPGYH